MSKFTKAEKQEVKQQTHVAWVSKVKQIRFKLVMKDIIRLRDQRTIGIEF